jgi:hypothetical protein
MEAKSQYQHFIPRFVLRDFAAEKAAGNGYVLLVPYMNSGTEGW